MGACLQSITCIRWAAAITQLRFITQSELLTQSPAADQDILRTNHYCHWCESKESWQLLGTIAFYLKLYLYKAILFVVVKISNWPFSHKECILKDLSRQACQNEKWCRLSCMVSLWTKLQKISRGDVLFIVKRIQVVILNSQWEMWENDLMKDLVISAFVVIQRLAIIH